MITNDQRMQWLEANCYYIEHLDTDPKINRDGWWHKDQEADEDMNRVPCSLSEWIDEQIRKDAK